MYRQASFSFRVRSKQNFNLLQRFEPSNRFQCCGYSGSARRTNEGPNGQKLLPESFPSGRSKEGIAVKGPTIGGPFKLINAERQVVTERDLLGHWVLLYFGYTSSPDVGPAELQKMTKAIDILESKQNVKLLPVFVTLDPQRDSPSHLKAYLREFDPRIVGLTGPVNAIRQMAQEYRIFFKKVEEDGNDYLVESSHNMYLMNPDMEIMRCFGLEYGATELAESIVSEMKRSTT
ncbi:Protein SCO1-like protein 2 mitochondrial [Bienertia sinuspersici]